MDDLSASTPLAQRERLGESRGQERGKVAGCPGERDVNGVSICVSEARTEKVDLNFPFFERTPSEAVFFSFV